MSEKIHEYLKFRFSDSIWYILTVKF